MRLIDADAAKEKCKEFENELLTSDEVIAFLDKLCPTVETSSLWISVKDRLPDGKACYAICWRDERGIWQAALARFAYSNASGEFRDVKPIPAFFGFDEHRHVQQYEKAEFWTPLPEPPQEIK